MFVLMVISVIWLVMWPVLMYYYFKPSTPNDGLAQHDQPIDYNYQRKGLRKNFIDTDIAVAGGYAHVKFVLNGREYLLSDEEANHIVASIRSRKLTVDTINEVKKLDG